MSEHSNVTEFPAERFPGNGNGHGGDLRQRLRKLEIEVNTIKTRLRIARPRETLTSSKSGLLVEAW